MDDQATQPFTTLDLTRQRLAEHLAFLYGDDVGSATLPKLIALLESAGHNRAAAALPHRPALGKRITQADAMLITYGDQVSEPGVPPLRTLAEVLQRYFTGLVSSVHLLPFYPYTSDDGFSVVDYTEVDPALGNWKDIALMRQQFKLMLDAVINHISASSPWFQGFLQGTQPYTDYFIAADADTDVTSITRPRATPLLTPFETAQGTQHVWTTFSADQVDLNYANPEVLLAVTEVLLFYAAQGAEFLRLDAIGYLWKEIGTSSIHLPKAHRVIQLWRDVFDAVAPEVVFISETNVPHEDNISYFGDGTNEAQLVYQFPLGPLVLHAFAVQDTRHLTRWAAQLEPLSEGISFFNFLASHDGIGVMPAKGFLSDDEVGQLVQRVQRHGGHVSFKRNADGSESAYELNITYFDALNDPAGGEAMETMLNRFITSQAIMLAMAGLPGIYIHSLVGSHNHHAGVERTGRLRSINREKWQRAALEAQLEDPTSHAAQVLARYATLLRIRAAEPAFHPIAPQIIVEDNQAIFALLRGPLGNQVLCAHNVSSDQQALDIPTAIWGEGTVLRDLLRGTTIEMASEASGMVRLVVPAYQTLWVRPVSPEDDNTMTKASSGEGQKLIDLL